MDLLWNSASLRLSCAVAFSRCAWATFRFASAWGRLLRSQAGQPAAGDVLEPLAELLLRLHERRARQHQNRVLLRQAARHLDVVLIGEAGPDRHRHRLAMPQGEDDEVAAELAAGSPAAPSPAPAVSTPALPAAGPLKLAAHLL